MKIILFHSKNEREYLPDSYLVNSKLSEKNLLDNGYKKEKNFSSGGIKIQI